MTRSTLFFAVAAAAATVATVSFPAYAAETQSTEVHYSDINLASTDGAAALKVRVERAAKRVCGVGRETELKSMIAANNCAKLSLAKAMPQVELALANAGTQVAEAGRVTVAAH